MASERLDAYNGRLAGRGSETADSSINPNYDYDRDELIPAMALRSYHLPEYNYCADWMQFMSNTHPLFGICCHHRLHPVAWPMRLLHLLGSVIFGLLVTNLIWLFMVYENERDQDRPVVTIEVGSLNETLGQIAPLANLTTTDSDGTSIEITEGMIFLWTVGGTLHAFFDVTIWYLTACVCCLPGRSMESWAGLKRYGVILIAFTMVAIGAFTSFLVVLRATLSDNEDADLNQALDGEDGEEDINPLTDWEDKSSFQFLISYLVEVLLALVVYYPIVGTVLFTGVLGCGRIPVLGGRPYEVKQAERRQERLEAKELKRQRRSRGSPDLPLDEYTDGEENNTYKTTSSSGDLLHGSSHHRRNNSNTTGEPHRPSEYALHQQEQRNNQEQEQPLSSSNHSNKRKKKRSSKSRNNSNASSESGDYGMTRSMPPRTPPRGGNSSTEPEFYSSVPTAETPRASRRRSYQGGSSFSETSERFQDDIEAPAVSNHGNDDGIRVSPERGLGRKSSTSSRRSANSYDDDGIRVSSGDEGLDDEGRPQQQRRPPRSRSYGKY
eukprot:CAMPEP_0172468636 /NCGR_PEP_ID=MMETSP1065-20121228/61726_1 /TAXON_ID=265537 /ORGANISM="Amphiprora paludosa, Strain CCMP125" /LENGTH=551 /DNA_ID=CAMNT_0013226063 /DNA_START=16 /DNA_END=1671 /DNA_ORIENTATION=+